MSHCLGYAQRSETFYIEGETRNVKIFNHLFSNKFSRNFPVNTEKNEMATLIIYEIINPNSARTQALVCTFHFYIFIIYGDDICLIYLNIGISTNFCLCHLNRRMQRSMQILDRHI